MFSKRFNLSTFRMSLQWLRKKSSMGTVPLADENHKKYQIYRRSENHLIIFVLFFSGLQPNYNIPFSLELSSELRKENSQFMLVFPGNSHAKNSYSFQRQSLHPFLIILGIFSST